jgi:branched-subunit amino acid aminotransferase/4-amino-4-deoxychorismate lyase
VHDAHSSVPEFVRVSKQHIVLFRFWQNLTVCLVFAVQVELLECIEAMLFVVLSPVGPYFPSGLKPIKLYVETENVRAFPGGVGNSKIGANYAQPYCLNSGVPIGAVRKYVTWQPPLYVI